MDKISLDRIDKLHPLIREDVKSILEECSTCNIPIRITQGWRSIKEQNDLYAIGRTRHGTKVTNAKGGMSWHNYGLAFDFVLLSPNGKDVIWNRNTDINHDNKYDWLEVVEIALAYHFQWGGSWKTFKDYPHFEKTFGMTIGEAFQKLENGDVDKNGYIII